MTLRNQRPSAAPACRRPLTSSVSSFFITSFRRRRLPALLWVQGVVGGVSMFKSAGWSFGKALGVLRETLMALVGPPPLLTPQKGPHRPPLKLCRQALPLRWSFQRAVR